MDNVIYLSNFDRTKRNSKDNNLRLTKKATVIYTHEILVLLRVLIEEKNKVKMTLNSALEKKNKQDICYWQSIFETFNNLITKSKKLNRLENLFTHFNFMELDCLISAIEDFIHERGLLEAKLIKDDSPYITNAINKLYGILLPIYEDIRYKFDTDLH